MLFGYASYYRIVHHRTINKLYNILFRNIQQITHERIKAMTRREIIPFVWGILSILCWLFNRCTEAVKRRKEHRYSRRNNNI